MLKNITFSQLVAYQKISKTKAEEHRSVIGQAFYTILYVRNKREGRIKNNNNNKTHLLNKEKYSL